MIDHAILGSRLAHAIDVCHKCGLSHHRHNVVMGRGVLPAQAVFIGEAPGESEDLLAEAFVGLSGRLLDRMVEQADLHVYDLFFTNTVLCRPCDGRAEKNREPTKDEVKACQMNVEAILTAALNGSLDPAIVFVGQVAARFYGRHKMLKPFKQWRIIHPAAVLRQGEGGPFHQHNVMMLKEVRNHIDKGERR